MSKIEVPFVRLHPQALEPTRATEGAAGYDLYSVERMWLAPRGFRAVDTGIGLQLPPGYEAQVRPRSGLAIKHGLGVLNSPGTIDSDYRGSIRVILVNHGDTAFLVEPGMRIAQLVFARVELPALLEVTALERTLRDQGGFGSTGV